MIIRFHILSGPGQGTFTSVAGIDAVGEITVGRSVNCTVVVPGHGVSRRHLFIHVRHGSIEVRDASTDGTRVEGLQRIPPNEPTLVSDDAVLILGEVRVALEVIRDVVGEHPRNPELLESIRNDPDDDAPRLVYADWLEGLGDPRAELIRLQCRLASGERFPGRGEAQARVNELKSSYHAVWVYPFFEFLCRTRSSRSRPGRRVYSSVRNQLVLQRGFLRTIGTTASAFAEYSHIVELEPLTEIRIGFHPDRPSDFSQLASSPALGRVHTLDVSIPSLRDLETLLASDHLRPTRLRILFVRDLFERADQGAAVRALASAPTLAGLNHLDIRSLHISDEQAALLQAAPHLQHLEALDH